MKQSYQYSFVHSNDKAGDTSGGQSSISRRVKQLGKLTWKWHNTNLVAIRLLYLWKANRGARFELDVLNRADLK